MNSASVIIFKKTKYEFTRRNNIIIHEYMYSWDAGWVMCSLEVTLFNRIRYEFPRHSKCL